MTIYVIEVHRMYPEPVFGKWVRLDNQEYALRETAHEAMQAAIRDLIKLGRQPQIAASRFRISKINL